MKQSLPIIFSLLLAVSLLFGCAPQAQPEPAPAPVQPAEPAPEPVPPAQPEQTAEVEPTERPVLRLATLKGPTGMGMVRLMQRNDADETAIKYEITIASTPDEISAKLITGEVDIAAAPINLASVLYNKTQGGVSMIGLNTLGVLYILENGDSIQSFADLSGKTIHATGQGATPEYILNYLLEQHGLTDKVTVQYMNDHAELAAMLAAGQVEIGMLPEPNVTAALMNNADLHIALNLTGEWDALASGTKLVQGSIVARSEYLAAHADVVNTFLEEYADSVTFVNTSLEEAAQLVAQYELMAAAPAALRAIPGSNIVCITGEEMRNDASAMLTILHGYNPDSVGGMLPGNDFYYIMEN